MAGNQTRGEFITREQIMREHDALPPALRLVDMSTVSKWSAECVRYAWAAAGGGAALPKVGERMRRAVDLLGRGSSDSTFYDYGPAHPECPEYLKAEPAPKGAWWAEQNRRAK